MYELLFFCDLDWIRFAHPLKFRSGNEKPTNLRLDAFLFPTLMKINFQRAANKKACTFVQAFHS